MPKLKKKSTKQRQDMNKSYMTKKRTGPVKQAMTVSTRQKNYLEKDENVEKHSKRMGDFRKTEEYRERDRLRKRMKLDDLEEKEKRNKSKSESQKKRLENPEARDLHKKLNSESQKKRLENPEARDLHKKLNSESQKKHLENPEARDLHKKLNSESQKKRLENPEARDLHKKANSKSQKKRLEDPETHHLHNKRQSESQKNRLKNPERRVLHNLRQRRSQKKRLQHSGKHAVYKTRNSRCQKRRLLNPEIREIHNERQRRGQKRRLEDEEQRNVHNKRQSEAQRKRLADPRQRNLHNRRQRITQTKRLRRPIQRETHIARVRRRNALREKIAVDQRRQKIFDTFQLLKLEGPVYPCCCCDRLNFKTSVTSYSASHFPSARMYFNETEETGYFCTTCARSLKGNRIPTLAIINGGLKFPDVPSSVSKLSDLEERFVSPLIPFMSIRASIGDQYIVRGRAVNVPTDIPESVKILPRFERETQIIPICFRRKKAYKTNVLFEMVRPKVILDALEELEHSEVYHHFGIVVDRSRVSQKTVRPRRPSKSDNEESDSESNSDEEPQEEPVNVTDDITMLVSDAIIFAPGEGKKPFSLFKEYAECKSFIKIYGGKLIKKPSALTYHNWVKSEIMRSDRRCANIVKLFFSALKLRTSKVSSSINFCLRKSKLKKSEIAANMLNDDYVRNIELCDSGYMFLTVDCGSPAFWEEKKKEVFAMIRQLGPPTIFVTLSAAETKWFELIVLLKKIVDDEQITLNDAAQLEYKEKVRLIKTDPVTCARYFEYRMRELLKLMKADNSIFREYTVQDFYVRTEFQQRGSPHWHCLLWLRNPPRISEDDENRSVLTFVDRFISCRKDPDLEERGLIELQTHRHTFTCRKGKNKKKCRFDIPFFPLRETMILRPLKKDEKTKLEYSNMRKIRSAIQEYLAKAHKDKNISLTIEDILFTFAISDYDTYIEIIRSNIDRPIVMLKRKPCECMINAYNEDILRLNCANMDIQFIVDTYACAIYVINYLNKSNKGMSKLMRDAMSEIKKGNYTMKQQLLLLGNKFLQASEFSAQESVYYLLAMPLSKCSRACVFINTNPPEKRIAIVKSKKELQLLDPNSEDIYKRNMIDHYVQRPDVLEDICLAYFYAWYEYSSNSFGKQVRSESDTDDDNHINTNKALRLKDKTGYIRKRKHAKIIRYVNFRDKVDLLNSKREKVMLYFPWRNEDEMMISAGDLFNANVELIGSNCAQFVFNDIIDDLLEEAKNVELPDEVDDEDDIIPPELAVFGDFSQGDLIDDILKITDLDIDPNNDLVSIPVPNMVSDQDYANIVCTLNEKQRVFLIHVIHSFKIGLFPIYHCVLGGAGVGKTRLIQAIFQTLLRNINKHSTDLESLKVLLCAPTGKAAFGIHGATLHSAFVLPLNQNSHELVPLNDSTRNTLCHKLKDVRLIIIDEISMVGSRMFQQVNTRLQQLFRNDKPFGGISVIVFGDFNQLSPVGDVHVFKANRWNPYSEIVGNPLWRMFSSFTLTEIMRQKDDALFAEALNSLAMGNMTKHQVDLFQSRIVTNPKEIPVDAIRLFRTNKEVDAYNSLIIDQDPNKVLVVAKDIVPNNVSEETKTRLLNIAKTRPSKDTQGLPSELFLSIGIKYMVTINVLVEDGIVNGAVGVLKSFDTDAHGEINRLWFAFPDEIVGKKRRTEIRNRVSPDWTALDKEIRTFYPTKNFNITIRRKQFPCVPAEAITIHKSQGGTYSKVAVNLFQLKLNEMYVALSRCTALKGLYLIGKSFKPPISTTKICKDLQYEIRRLGDNPLGNVCLFPKNFPGKTSIVYHNVNILKGDAHWRDLNNFIQQQRPNVFIAAETRTTIDDDVTIEGYQVVIRMDGAKKIAGCGFIIYRRLDETFDIIHQHQDVTNKTYIVAGICNDVIVCTGYRSPSYTYHNVHQQIEKMLTSVHDTETKKIIFVGDFNVDLKKQPNHALFIMLKRNGLSSNLPDGTATTSEDTSIDLVFSNFSVYCGVTEALFSDHKQLLCVLDTAIENVNDGNTNKSDPPCIGMDEGMSLIEAIQEGNALFLKLKREPILSDDDRKLLKIVCASLRTQYHRFINHDRNRMPINETPHLRNFIQIDVPKDGNCFYYAISLLMCGNDRKLMSCLRAVEAAHIINNAAFIQQMNSLLLTDRDWTIESVLTSKTYAINEDIFLLATILRRPINVYINDNYEMSLRFAPFENENEFHIHLNTAGPHFTALIPNGNIRLPQFFQHSVFTEKFQEF